METKVIKLDENLYAIDQEMVRAYLIIGTKKAVLLDTGAIKADILKLIREVTMLPIQLVLTHADRDHIENATAFPEVFMHKDEEERFKDKGNSINIRMSFLNDGDIVDLGDCELRVLHLPGHTAGSLGLLDESKKILFSGDTLSYGPVFMFGEGRNMSDFGETLRKLREMIKRGEISEVYPCHNVTPIDADKIEDLISSYNGIKDGSLIGKVPPKETGLPEDVKVYTVGKCSILY